MSSEVPIRCWVATASVYDSETGLVFIKPEALPQRAGHKRLKDTERLFADHVRRMRRYLTELTVVGYVFLAPGRPLPDVTPGFDHVIDMMRHRAAQRAAKGEKS